MSVASEAVRAPVISLPGALEPEVRRMVETAVLATATSSASVGLSLVAGRHQAAVAVTSAVGHLAVASTWAGTAFVREVDEEARPLLIGLLAALATLAALLAATHVGGPAL